MATTLTYNDTTVTLPDDLYWADEFGWQPVQQTAERTITGALVIQQATRIAGRSITLRPDSPDAAWISRGVLETLKDWSQIPQCEIIISYRGIERRVIWRHHDGEVIEATPVIHYADAQSVDWYTATLKFMEI